MKRWGILYIFGILLFATFPNPGIAQTTFDRLPTVFPGGVTFAPGDAFAGVITAFQDTGYVFTEEGGVYFLTRDSLAHQVKVIIKINSNLVPSDLGHVRHPPLSLWSLVDGSEKNAKRYVEIDIISREGQSITSRSEWVDFSNIESIRQVFGGFLERKEANDLNAPGRSLDDTYRWHKAVSEILEREGFVKGGEEAEWVEFNHSPDVLFKRSRSFTVRVRLIDYVSDRSVLCEVHVSRPPGTLLKGAETRAVFQIKDIKSRVLLNDLIRGLTRETSGRRACAIIDDLQYGDYERAVHAYEMAQHMGVDLMGQEFGRDVEANRFVDRMRFTDFDGDQHERLAEYMADFLRVQVEEGAAVDVTLGDLEAAVRNMGVKDLELRSNENLRAELDLLLRDCRYGFPKDWMPKFRDAFMREALRGFKR